ncbi:MAG: O-antigen translocase [Aquificae bacterium]|nr:O-antigen translocase [Aquificota bacterium]
MTLIRTSILSAISTIIKVVTGFITVKIVSVIIGPSGLALVAQVQNFVRMTSLVATGGIGTGIVKYTAEFRENEQEKKKIWSNALKLALILTFLVAITVAIFSKYLSLKLLGSTEFYFVFILFSISVIFFVLNVIFLAILNGQGEIKKLTIINIISSIIALIVSVSLVITLRIKGALIAGIISQSIVFFVTLLFILKANWFKLSMFINGLDKKIIKNLLKFSAMTVTTTVTSTGSLIFLRNYIGNNLGWDSAGYWQGVWRISETYLMLITTTLSIYYLPKLSSIKDKTELKKEIIYGYKLIMPIVIFLAILIYLSRDILIRIIFTEEFMPMSELFFFQLMGDVIKIASWLISFLLLSKAIIMPLIIVQIVFSFTFIIFGVIFINIFSLKGITIAFFTNYVLYLLTIFFISIKFYSKVLSK